MLSSTSREPPFPGLPGYCLHLCPLDLASLSPNLDPPPSLSPPPPPPPFFADTAQLSRMFLAGKPSHSSPLTPTPGPHIILGIRGPRPRLLTGSSRSRGLRGPCFCISKASCSSWATENFSLENGVYPQINQSQELSTWDLWITQIYRIHFLVCKAEQNQRATRSNERTVSFLYKAGQDVLEESPCFQEHGALSPPC